MRIGGGKKRDWEASRLEWEERNRMLESAIRKASKLTTHDFAAVCKLQPMSRLISFVSSSCRRISFSPAKHYAICVLVKANIFVYFLSLAQFSSRVWSNFSMLRWGKISFFCLFYQIDTIMTSSDEINKQEVSSTFSTVFCLHVQFTTYLNSSPRHSKLISLAGIKQFFLLFHRVSSTDADRISLTTGLKFVTAKKVFYDVVTRFRLIQI